MGFPMENEDISKQAHEVIFSHKRSIASHPPLTFNSIPGAQTNSQKHLGMQLDKKLNFEEHLSRAESKVNKTVGIIRKLQNVLPRSALITIYKSVITPHLDHGDIIYDKAFEKVCEKLGLESLKSRRWYRKMSFV